MNSKVCTKCKRDRPLYLFYKKEKAEDGLSCWCRECQRQYVKANYHKRTTAQKKHGRRVANLWAAANRGWFKFRAILNRYGLTLDQYAALEDSQDFLCAICREESTLCVDHNHTTTKVRGLLCVSCNMGLGCFKDNIERMRNACVYLEKQGTYGREDMTRGS